MKNPLDKPWQNLKNERIKPLGLALLIPQLTGLIGAVSTGSSVNTWYRRIEKPRWNPPARIFGPVWTTLYLLMGAASWLVWRRGREAGKQSIPRRGAAKLIAALLPGRKLDPIQPAAQQADVRRALGLYGTQLGLNMLWSVIFFGFRRIRLAALELILLLGLIGVTTRQFFKIDRRAGWLMVPYAAWSTFAAVLNSAIWWMNKDSEDGKKSAR